MSGAGEVRPRRTLVLSIALALGLAVSVAGASAAAPRVTEFTVPTSGGIPTGIAAGPDGSLWFTEEFGNQIGQITPSGSITEFALPHDDSLPVLITTGPDGNLWFTEDVNANGPR